MSKKREDDNTSGAGDRGSRSSGGADAKQADNPPKKTSSPPTSVEEKTTISPLPAAMLDELRDPKASGDVKLRTQVRRLEHRRGALVERQAEQNVKRHRDTNAEEDARHGDDRGPRQAALPSGRDPHQQPALTPNQSIKGENLDAGGTSSSAAHSSQDSLLPSTEAPVSPAARPEQRASHEERPRVDRLWIGVLLAIVAGLAIAIALRPSARGRTQGQGEAVPRPKLTDAVVFDPSAPTAYGFRVHPRELVPPFSRIRAPDGKTHRPKPKGRAVLAEWAHKPEKTPRVIVAAWRPKKPTPIPHERKYPEDPPPKRSAALLRVLTEPPGQGVEIDGASVGVTPVSIAVSRARTSFDIAVKGRGFKEIKTSVSPDEKGDFVFSAQMEPGGNDPLFPNQPR